MNFLLILTTNYFDFFLFLCHYIREFKASGVSGPLAFERQPFRSRSNLMKSNLAFLAAAVASGSTLIFSAAKAQELPGVLQSVWLVSTKLTYDPLLVAAFILAGTLAVGRILDMVRERKSPTVEAAA
jgi:hypothetical protein